MFLHRWRAVRGYDPRRRRTALQGPLHIQLQTVNRCNGACVMCPYGEANPSGPPEVMDNALFSRLLCEARGTGTVRMITLMLQNEPLLDKHLVQRSQEAARAMGHGVVISIVTNGSLLTRTRVDELCNSGIDRIFVSIDAVDGGTYAAIHSDDRYDNVVGNVEALLQREHRPQVVARFLRQSANSGQERAFARMWRRKGAAVQTLRITNRAGAVGSYERLSHYDEPLISRAYKYMADRVFPFCTMPFEAMYLLVDGRALLCCQDWGPSVIIGDLSRQPIEEVWNGEMANRYRHMLYTGQSRTITPCSECLVS